VSAVYTEDSGTGTPTVVFLHGQGATGVVWDGVGAHIARRQPYRRVVVDLPGHGRSGRLGDYAPHKCAAAIAAALPGVGPVALLGHSLGGLMALALADPMFALDVRGVVCLAMKVTWTDQETHARAERARRPPRVYPDRDAALRGFAAASGLNQGPPVPPDRLATGIAETEGGFRLVHDPATSAAPPLRPAELKRIAARARGPVHLVGGDQDPMVSPADLALVGDRVITLPGAGHYVHIGHPEVVADLLDLALAAD
jgi:pimeloyl-ACP methyl ester carboxylesterase